ncbi:MAG: aryl-sulfate sulfotransferase [Gammaproteobacteria bacterium]|nr:aryl-sulfate sulfotransferase [Gammaproteobacteria bacterium]
MAAAWGVPSVYPTGVTRYDPARAWNGYVVFDGRDRNTYLIDMNGNVVHRWSKIGFPSEILDPAVTGGKLGHLLVQEEGSGGHADDFYVNPAIAELDWEGNSVWRWGPEAPGGAAQQNHDWQRLANGNTLIIASWRHPVAGFTAPVVRDQAIYEIAPSGKIVWRWVVSEHLKEFSFSPLGLKMIRGGFTSAGSQAGFLTINNMQTLGPNKWYDAGDQRFHPDNIMIDSREGNVIAIIDRKTGHFVWRMGPYYPDHDKSPAHRLYSDKVPRPVDQIVGQHDAHLIPKGLPGAGNLLVFDNQGAAGFPPAYLNTLGGTRVLEIDPITRMIVWQYTGESSGGPLWSFHSSFIGSARRLPNGNTLINEGMNGRIFQVTPAGEIVWEYVSPYTGDIAFGSRIVRMRWVYRAQPVPYDWVPAGTPRSETLVAPPDLAAFHVPAH